MSVTMLADLAARVIKTEFPQSVPRPWRGNDGAEATIGVLCNSGHQRVKVALHKDDRSKCWFAECEFTPTSAKEPIQEVGSSANEATRKLKAAILAS